MPPSSYRFSPKYTMPLYRFLFFVLPLVLSLLPTSVAIAQEAPLLSLEEAINLALANNHQVQLRRIETRISANNVNPAVVGKAPQLNLNASYELGWSTTETETLPLGPGENEPFNLDGISNSLFISPEISWLLLDGKASFFRLEQLRTADLANQLALEQAMETTVLQVSRLYLQAAQQLSQRAVLVAGLDLTAERLRRTRTANRYGTNLSLLSRQIESNYKTDSIQLVNLDLAVANLKRDLNQLMGRNATLPFELQTDFFNPNRLSLPPLEAALLEQNTLLELQQRQLEVAKYDQELTQSAFRPSLSAYANVSFAYLQDDANFLQSNRALGPNVGLRFQLPISDGGARRINAENATMAIQLRELELEELRMALLKDLRNAYASYEAQLEALAIEQENLSVFEENLTFTENSFQQGTSNNLEVRAAQLELLSARERIVGYLFAVCQSELQIAYLAGLILE
ncbi:MAG: TolC family protein [Bacteroidota bacterium]